MKRRLYLQIYLGFLALVLIVICVAGAMAWSERSDARRGPRFIAAAVRLIGERLPPPGSPPAQTQRALAELRRRLEVDATLRAPDGRRLASVGELLPEPKPERGAGPNVWIHRRGTSPALAVRLADGRWLTMARPRSDHDGGLWWLFRFALLAGVIAVGAYPVARRIARRLERLQLAVDDFGSGELSARVPVEGADEVADVARSFNEAAARIQALVTSQKRLLTSASHELRSPLARLRVAVELMGANATEELRTEAETDIRELDELIEDLLTAARLETLERLETAEPVDLMALLVEESARVDAEASGDAVTIKGDARLVRRLLRNLLENARQHGGDGEVEARLDAAADGDGALLTVADRGPGVAASERERIFEPFYRPPGVSEGRGGGFGMGLTLVREIARHHGGDARCLEREGGGTVIEVRLRGVPS